MPERRNTRTLFKEWRNGDAEAGQLMAQQVADWYYAIATSRLGEQRGRGPCEAACAAFGAGVAEVTDSRKLVTWAHELIVAEVKKSGTRAADGDDPSAFTGKQRPKPLLARARVELPAEFRLLEAVYGADADRSAIDQLATPLGGNPMGILQARYRLKRWLRDRGGIPFEVAPETPVLDRAPLPLYEADRMANTLEEAAFEQWMLTDLDLCKDIAEFAHFAIALRGGVPLPAEKPAPAPRPAEPPPKPAPEPKPAVAPPVAPPTQGQGGLPWVPIAIGGVLLLLVLSAAAAAAVFSLT
jgi:hypothetical protein